MIVAASLAPTWLGRRHFLNSARIRAGRPGPDRGGPTGAPPLTLNGRRMLRGVGHRASGPCIRVPGRGSDVPVQPDDSCARRAVVMGPVGGWWRQNASGVNDYGQG